MPWRCVSHHASYERLANTLSRLAKGARSRCEKLEAKIGRTGQLGPDDELAVELAWQTETQAQGLTATSEHPPNS